MGLAASSEAIDAAIDGAIRAGLIVDRQGEVLFNVDASTGHLRLPFGRKVGQPSGSGVLASLSAAGISVRMGFLFAVFEDTGGHSVFYRATCDPAVESAQSDLQFLSLIPETLARVRPMADRVMLDRYATERSSDLLGIYAGTSEIGEVRALTKGDN